MKQYAVSVTEISSKIVLVNAEDEDKACKAARIAWEYGDIILNTDDFQSVDYELESDYTPSGDEQIIKEQ